MTRRWWALAAGAVTLAAALRLLASTVADPDLWGHILFGQRTLSLGLERRDPFSYLSGGHEWINHEVLSEVSFAVAYGLGGGPALIALKIAVGMLLVGLVYAHVISRGSDPLRAGLLLIPSLLLLVPGLATVRPQMFTFLFFTLVLMLLHRAETSSDRWLVPLPLILGLWINFHGGVLAGAGVLGVWAAARVLVGLARGGVATAWKAARIPLALGLACLVTLLANPYGWRLPLFLVRTALVPRPDIVEWQPLSVASLPGAVYLAMIALCIWSIRRAPGRVGPPLLAVLAILTLLPLTAVRHLQLFALGIPVLMADAFGEAWRRGQPPRTAGRGEGWLVGAITAAAAALLAFTGLRDASCIRIDPARSIGFPMRAVAWLSDTGVEGNLATYFDWGEYAIWHLAPGIRVSMDGRRETVYPDSIYQEYLRFQNGVGSWRDLLERPETDMVLFPVGSPAYNLTAADVEWRRVYSDSLAGVFARRAGGSPAALDGTAPRSVPVDGRGVCVPRARGSVYPR